jgi:hypothetical protein
MLCYAMLCYAMEQQISIRACFELNQTPTMHQRQGYRTQSLNSRPGPARVILETPMLVLKHRNPWIAAQDRQDQC